MNAEDGLLSVRRESDGKLSLTEDGRAEFQALRAEIIERLRAQQQATQFTLMLITAMLAGAASLPGRVDGELLLSFGSSTALIPVTLLALLFASLAAVYAEQEVGVAYAGAYVARRLGMPWGTPATASPRLGSEERRVGKKGTCACATYAVGRRWQSYIESRHE